MTMTTTNVIGSSFSVVMQANANNTPIQVDFGDGIPVNNIVGTSFTKISGTIIGSQTIKIYGSGITYLRCSSLKLTTLDVSQYTTLTYLDCEINLLTTLDITKNTVLTSLICSNNDLIALDLTKNNLLTEVICYDNKLTALDISQNQEITKLTCDMNQISTLDVSKNVKLQMLTCSKNKISSLDISKNVALTYVDCTSNLLSSFDVNSNKALSILICSSNNLTSLNVGNCTALSSLVCGYNKITELDVSNNTLLNSVQCSSNQLVTLDFTHNLALTFLECFDNQLTSLDVTHNTLLTLLSCEYNQLSTLDISQNNALTDLNCYSNNLNHLYLSTNTKLKNLDCSHNNLNTLDISANTDLTVLKCSYNQLTTIDVTKNVVLKTFYSLGNNLTFKTLNLPQSSWTDYQYDYQHPVSIHKTMSLMIEVDLSSQLMVNENITNYVWKTQRGVTLVKGTDYTITDGKTIFLKTQSDSVFCVMTNTLLPYVTVSTKYTSLHGPMSMTTSQAIGSTFSFYLQANADNSPIQVDFGDGTLVSKTIGTYGITITGSLINSQTVKIYGNGITYLSCCNSQLTALNVSENESLESLLCYNNILTSLNVTRNISLTWLNFHDNPLSSLDITKNTSLAGLFCSYTQLSNLDVSKNISLQYLYCDSSRLITLDISKNTILKELGCAGNKLTLLDVTQNTALKKLLCNNNQLTFATLPPIKSSWTTFIYSPQNQIPIIKTLKANTELDLSNQLIVNGNTTAFNWKTKSGVTLVQGIDYTIANGKTIFLKPQSDSIYSEMVNASFPDFTDSNVLKTTYTKVTSGTDITDMNTPDIEIFAYRNTLYINIPYNAQVSIFEPNGRLVVSKPVFSGSNSLQLQNNGIYLVKLIDNKGSATKKIYIE